MNPAGKKLALLLVVAALGCRRESVEQNPTTAPPSEQEAKLPPPAAEESRPPGPVVIASAQGKRGKIVVEDRQDRRVLTIDGVVQGTAPKAEGAAVSRDPLVTLVDRLARDDSRALLIGLGTGRTATQLAANRAVDVVELESSVIEFAKAHFGYAGEAIQGDGAEFLANSDAAYGLVVLDAFDGTRPPAELVSNSSLAKARDALLSGGVIAIRLFGEPDAPWIDEIRRGLSPLHVRVFGTGVGTESQNLYLVASDQHMHLAGLRSKHVRQVYPTQGAKLEAMEIVGYLIRERHTGALAIDLPHEEMGAQRFLITGSRAEELARALPKLKQFPHAADDEEAKANRTTMRTLVGGGGVLRTDLHYSPVVVGVKGKATVIAQIHPDAAMRVPQGVRRKVAARLRQPVPKDEPRLPYGGSLYEIEVEDIEGVFTKSQWDKLRRGPLRRPLSRAKAHAKSGKLTELRADLVEYLRVFDETFGSVAPMLAARGGIADMAKALEPYASTPAPAGAARAKACERVAKLGHWQDADAALLVDPLIDCAIAEYEAIIAGKDPRKTRGAALMLRRLLDSEADRLDFDDPKRAARLLKKSRKLRKKALGPPPRPPVRPPRN